MLKLRGDSDSFRGAAATESEQNVTPCTDFDMAYFHSYAHVGIHEEECLLICESFDTLYKFEKDVILIGYMDCVRTDTYGAAIMQLKSYIEGKANEVVKASNLSEKIIVLRGRVEDVEIDEAVDAIISEWMGYMLLYEQNKVHLNFEEPTVETISGENVLTWPLCAPLHGFVFWFDVEFSCPATSPINALANNPPLDGGQNKKRTNPNDALVLSTAPEDTPKHWQQTVIYFHDPVEMEQDQLIEVLVAGP
ncbi:hypothetical protein GH714_017099 [Hevea brasiliensis]|uniref:Protein arginine N-methyltransferase domain-containing protein n=1 Tax=Hevea brasiliensis TaxID=3981 RepID=A0A6A6ND04_HEVBR|nr:hypothetical protein GH714_017099 [Hevea brasiliensis]